MKKILILFLLTNTIFLFSKDYLIKDLELETIYKIEYGWQENQLEKVSQPMQGDTHNYSTDLNTYNEGFITIDVFNGRKLAIIDKLNDKITKIDTSIELEGSVEQDSDKILISSKLGLNATVYDLKLNKVIFNMRNVMDWEQVQNLNLNYFTLRDNILFSERNNGGFVVIDLEIKEGEKFVVLTNNNAVEFLNSHNDFEIKDEKFLFYKGQFFTKDSKKFKEYISKGDNYLEYKDFLESISFGERTYYSGVDNEGNYYWTRGFGCFIFSNKGVLISTIVAPNNLNGKYDSQRYSVDEDGNLYRMYYNDTGYEIKKLKRFW